MSGESDIPDLHVGDRPTRIGIADNMNARQANRLAGEFEYIGGITVGFGAGELDGAVIDGVFEREDSGARAKCDEGAADEGAGDEARFELSRSVWWWEHGGVDMWYGRFCGNVGGTGR